MDFVLQERLSDAPFVERIWRAQSLRADSFISHAASEWEIVLMQHHGKANIVVRGPATKARPAEFPADADFLGIVFKLGTFMPHLPTVNRLDGNDAALPVASGSSFWLNSSTWQLPNYDNADVFVNRLVRDGLLASDPVVEAVLQNHEQAKSEPSDRSLPNRFFRCTRMTH